MAAYNEHSVFLSQPDGPSVVDTFQMAFAQHAPCASSHAGGNPSSGSAMKGAGSDGVPLPPTLLMTPAAYHHYLHTRKAPAVFLVGECVPTAAGPVPAGRSGARESAALCDDAWGCLSDARAVRAGDGGVPGGGGAPERAHQPLDASAAEVAPDEGVPQSAFDSAVSSPAAEHEYDDDDDDGGDDKDFDSEEDAGGDTAAPLSYGDTSAVVHPVSSTASASASVSANELPAFPRGPVAAVAPRSARRLATPAVGLDLAPRAGQQRSTGAAAPLSSPSAPSLHIVTAVPPELAPAQGGSAASGGGGHPWRGYGGLKDVSTSGTWSPSASTPLIQWASSYSSRAVGGSDARGWVSSSHSVHGSRGGIGAHGVIRTPPPQPLHATSGGGTPFHRATRGSSASVPPSPLGSCRGTASALSEAPLRLGFGAGMAAHPPGGAWRAVTASPRPGGGAMLSPSNRVSTARSPVTCGFLADMQSLVNNPQSFPVSRAGQAARQPAT